MKFVQLNYGWMKVLFMMNIHMWAMCFLFGHIPSEETPKLHICFSYGNHQYWNRWYYWVHDATKWKQGCYLWFWGGLDPEGEDLQLTNRCWAQFLKSWGCLWSGWIEAGWKIGIGCCTQVFQKIFKFYYWNNNIAQLYFILGRAKLCWNFSSILKDGFDIHRFSNRKWVLTMCSVGNLWISEASLSQLEKFQRSSALPNIK